jgi:hypothetical protein
MNQVYKFWGGKQHSGDFVFKIIDYKLDVENRDHKGSAA